MHLTAFDNFMKYLHDNINAIRIASKAKSKKKVAKIHFSKNNLQKEIDKYTKFYKSFAYPKFT